MSQADSGELIARPNSDIPLNQSMFATAFAALTTVLAYFLWRDGNLFIFSAKPDLISSFAIFYALAAMAFASVRYDQFPFIFSTLARVTALGILVFLLVERPGYTLVFEEHANLARYVDWGSWVAIVLAVVSVWRPSFLFPVAYYAISTRFISIPISGFEAPDLDIRYMMDLAQFLAFGACALSLLGKVNSSAVGERLSRTLSLIDQKQLAVCFAFIAFGLHLGNYFWSGYEKLVIGPYPWTWTLENQTQNLMLIGIKRGILPWPSPSPITQAVFEGFSSIVVVSNVLVVVTQLFAIVAALRLRWLWIATLAYDALHIGIYVFGGLFFWPWIWNNISILVALRGRTDEEIGWLPKLCCMVTVVLGFNSSFGASATLAWFDVVDVKVPVLQVETPDKTWVDVPVAFYMNHSQLIVMGLEDRTKTQGHYAPTIRGGVLDYERFTQSGKCLAPAPINDVETENARRERLENLRRFVIAHHKNMVSLMAKFGHYIYYFHSHHQPSNPWLHRDFDSLDISKIRRYRLVVQSICMSLSGGALQERELKRDEVIFDVE